MNSKHTYHLGWLSTCRDEIFGIAIIYIIFFHYAEGYCEAVDADLANAMSWWGKFMTGVHMYAGTAAVDVFIFLSGVGLYFSFNKNSSLKDFYAKRFTRVFIPYLVTALPFWIIKDIYLLGLTVKDVLADLFYVTLFTEGTITIWFIGLIMLMYLVFPFVYHAIGNGKTYNTILVCGIMAVIYISAWKMGINESEVGKNINIAYMRIPSFIIGVFAGKFVKEKAEIPVVPAVISIAVYTGLGIYGNIISDESADKRYTLAVMGVGVAALCAWIIHFFKEDGVLRTVLRSAGRCSLELYLSHITLRNLFSTMGIDLYGFEEYMVMICMSVIFASMLKKFDDITMDIIRSKILHRQRKRSKEFERETAKAYVV